MKSFKVMPVAFLATAVLLGTVSASLFKSLPCYTVAHFAPVSTLGFFDIAMFANADSRMTSVKDVLACAKANPGKLNIGTINVGSTQNLSAELFKGIGGIDATIVPYKGSLDVLVALRGNDVQIAFDKVAAIMGQYKSGSVNDPAISSDRRFPGLPNYRLWRRAGFQGTKRHPGTPFPHQPKHHAQSSTG
jgi:tripartite-type tricarboxylate transporter receptor subunit TctC